MAVCSVNCPVGHGWTRSPAGCKMPLAMHFFFFFLSQKNKDLSGFWVNPTLLFFCFANYFRGSDVHSAVNPLWRSLPGLNDSLCCIVHKMKVDLNANDKGQCPPCHPEEKSARPRFTAPTKVQCSRWKFASAFLAFHKPMWRSAWSTSCAVTQSSLRVHERPQERLHSCKKIVLVCRLSGPSSVVLRSISKRFTALGDQFYSMPHQRRRQGTEIRDPFDWRWIIESWLVRRRCACLEPRSLSSCSSSTSCIFTLSDKKVRLRCFEVRRHQLTGTYQGHKSIE